MNKVSGEIKFLRWNHKRNETIKNTVPEIKDAFDGLISRLDKAAVRISALRICQQKPKTEKLRKKQNKQKTKKKEKKIKKPKNCGIIIEGVTGVIKISKNDKEQKKDVSNNEKNFR